MQLKHIKVYLNPKSIIMIKYDSIVVYFGIVDEISEAFLNREILKFEKRFDYVKLAI